MGKGLKRFVIERLDGSPIGTVQAYSKYHAKKEAMRIHKVTEFTCEEIDDEGNEDTSV